MGKLEAKELFIQSLVEKDKDLLYQMLDEIYPIDIAIILEDIEDELLERFCYMVDKERLAEIVEESDINLQMKILENFHIDVISEEHTEDVLGLGGVGKEERIHSSLSESVRKRLPWLFVN